MLKKLIAILMMILIMIIHLMIRPEKERRGWRTPSAPFVMMNNTR
jgi:preprotein translocase subunit YajC